MSLRRALLLAAAFGLAVCGSALAGPAAGHRRPVCVDARTAESCSPSVEAKFDASFSPKALDKSKQTPATLRTTMSFATSDGSRPPALGQFEIAVDRHTRLSLKGVPVCHGGGRDIRESLQQRCKEALIGTGKMESMMKFPESSAISARGEVSIYNAGLRNGTRTFLAVTYVPIPTPAEVVITITVEHDSGRYGFKLMGAVPKIAGGAGSVTHLELGLRKSVLSATCPDRHLNTRFATNFADGTHLGGSVLRYCTPSR